jgi:simple sugar transport system permease protein
VTALFARREKPLTSPLISGLIIVGAAAIALIAGAGLMWLMGADPLTGYRELLYGMAGTRQNIAESLLKTTPLLIIALGIAIAFTASIWNIGAEGQFYMGALFSTWTVLWLADLPGYLLLPLAIIAAAVAGGLWGGIAGYFRARFNVNEIIVTVMMNYIAIFFIRYIVQGPLRETQSSGAGFPRTDPIPDPVWLPRIISGTRLHAGFIAALILAGIVYFLLRHTTFGYNLRAVGRNPTAALYAGIRVQRTIIWAMILSGALAGLAGLVEVLGVHHRLLDGISPGYGFIGIIVTLLGKQNPLGIVIAATLLASLNVGASTMQRGIGIPVSLVWTIEYLMVLLVVGAGILQTHYFLPWQKLWSRRKGG